MAERVDYRAIVTPTADGGWKIEVEEWGGARGHMDSDQLWRAHRVDTIAWTWTRRGAERKARRLIRLHVRARAHLDRDCFEVSSVGVERVTFERSRKES